MRYPALYIQFFQYYHQGKYWEAHEVLEELWQTQRENDFYHGLIQVAAIMHQLERGKVRGARKLAISARRYLAPFSPYKDEVSIEKILSWLDHCLQVLPKDVEKVEISELKRWNIPVCPLPRFDERSL